MKKFTLLLLLLTISIGAFAQTPDWAINLPKAKNPNPTMEYMSADGEGYSSKEAYNEAICNLLRKVVFRFGISVNSNDIVNAVYRGESLTTISRDYNIPPIKEVCKAEDSQSSRKRVYILCQVPIAGNIEPIFEPFDKCDKGQKRKKDKYQNDEFIWTILGGGYPWNVMGLSGFELKISRFGFMFNLGLDFSPIDVYIDDRFEENIIKTSFHYDFGLKFYLYKELFVDIGYGTIAKDTSTAHIHVDGTNYYYNGKQIIKTEDGFDKDIKESITINKGLSFHIGYNFFRHENLLMSISFGTVQNNNHKFMPCATLKVSGNFNLHLK